jgi:hypothetical protein
MHKHKQRSRGGIIVVLLFILAFFNAAWIVEMAVRHALALRPGIVVERAHIARLRVAWPGGLRLEDVQLGLAVGGKPLSIEAPAVALSGLQTFFSRDRQILLLADRAHVTYDKGEAVMIRFAGTLTADGISGPVTLSALRWDKLQAADVSAFVTINAAGTHVRHLKAAAYDGSVSGMMTLQAKKNNAYLVELSLQGIDVVKMSDLDPEIGTRLSGLVTGAVTFEGFGAQMRSLDVDLSMPSGGKVSAALLAALTQYLPHSREKERLDLLVRNGGKLAMETLGVSMKGGAEGRFSGEVHLKSREVNLELNLTHEINTDGTLTSLLAYGQNFLK